MTLASVTPRERWFSSLSPSTLTDSDTEWPMVPAGPAPGADTARPEPPGQTSAGKEVPAAPARLLLLWTALLLVTQVVIVHQVAEGLRGDGHHVGEGDPAVATAREDKLVVRVVVADAPHPGRQGTRR